MPFSLLTSAKSLQLATATLLLIAPLACNAQRPAQGSTAQKIAALKDLRDSGVISSDEYSQRVATLNGGTSKPATTTGARRTFQLQDPALGLSAATITLPAGWGFAGTVVHAHNCVIGGHSIQANMESPDGATGIIFIPTLVANGATAPQLMQQMRQGGCSVTNSARAADFIKNVILPHFRPNARIVSVADEPEFASKVQQLRQQLNQLHAQAPRSGGMIEQLPPVVEAARVRITYERNGRQEEEAISALTSCMPTRYNTMGYSTVECTADNIIAIHAPAGQLDALLTTKPPFDMTFHQDWQNRLAQVQRNEQQQSANQMVAQNQANAQNAQNYLANNTNTINGAAARSQAAADAITHRGEVFRQVDANRQGAIDHAAQGTAFSVNNTNTFQNGNGTNYSGLSNNFAHTYDDGQGHLLQTNSAYAPGGGAVWTELTPKY